MMQVLVYFFKGGENNAIDIWHEVPCVPRVGEEVVLRNDKTYKIVKLCWKNMGEKLGLYVNATVI